MITIAIGDLHGHDTWKKIIEQKPIFDKIVFLGDYIDSHTIDTDDQYNNLIELLEFKEKNPDKVILLRGNHDLSSGLGYSWAECSGYNPKMALKFPRDRFLKDTQWVYIENNTIYSHAGVTSTWLENVDLDSPEKINTLLPTSIFGFWSDNPFDIYGTSKTQGPLWVRPQTLATYAVGGYDQVVGHTPMQDNITNIQKAVTGGQNIWLCDALGIGQYLKIEDNNVEICRLED